ncbi:hypothetical protein [Actinomadura oligospora]|uniref:hypothetical protein n=1 Tax=Actinomadura oligospora TaxID=111804 RepID=UPI0012FB3DCF|nr:hypothetical protein [Actinomadura oligospora]
MDDLERYARAGMKADASGCGLDPDDRWEAAWFAVVERLYDPAAEPPAAKDLIYAARQGLWALSSANLHTHGVPSSGRADGEKSLRPQFARYWLGSQVKQTEAPFVAAITDRIALAQVLAKLPLAQREAVLALALYQDRSKAAGALGLTYSAFSSRIDNARRAVLELWHQHETPHGLRRDQRSNGFGLRPRVAAVLTAEQVPQVVLPDARAVFARLGAERLHSKKLLAELASARPQIYGAWDAYDMAQALRLCDVPPSRQFTLDGQYRQGYERCGLDEAHPEVAAEPDACDIILAAWLDQTRHAAARRELPAKHPRLRMRELVSQAGPEGITSGALADQLTSHRATVRRWLREDVQAGLLTKSAHGRYSAPAAAAEVA